MKLVLELFVEHIPSSNQLELKQLFEQEYVKHVIAGDVKVYCTVNRITVLAENLPDQMLSESISYKGPQSKFDINHISVQKFCEKISKQHDINAIDFLEDKDNYWHVDIPAQKLSIKQYLEDKLQIMLNACQCKVRMQWLNESHEAFIRPVRNILALLDDQVLHLRHFGLQANNITSTHTYEKKEIMQVDEYFNALPEVVFDDKDRIEILKQFTNAKINTIQPESKQCTNVKINTIQSESKQCTNVKVHSIQQELIKLVANHHEIMCPFAVQIDYNKHTFLLELPVEYIHQSLLDQQQAVPVYSNVMKNKHGQFAIDKLVFVAQIEATDQIKDSSYRTCISYLHDLYELYISDRCLRYDSETLQSLSTYKTDTIADKVERLRRLTADEILLKAIDCVKLDLITKSVQEFPQLQGLCASFVVPNIDNNVRQILRYYNLCANDLSACLMMLSDTTDVMQILRNDISCDDQNLYYGMYLYLIDTIDTFALFYIMDGNQVIGTKDPFGLRSMIRDIRLIGTILQHWHQDQLSIEYIICSSYLNVDELECSVSADVSMKNAMHALYGVMPEYFKTSLWESIVKCVSLLRYDNDKLEVILGCYKRISNFLKNKDIEAVDELDQLSEDMMGLCEDTVTLNSLYEVSIKLNDIFDNNQILHPDYITGRLYALHRLLFMYEEYAIFTDSLQIASENFIKHII